jgi:vacuolar-type H+-ATPase subunit I/STV1
LMADRDGLVARVRRVGRSATDADASAARPTVDLEDGRGAPDVSVNALEARLADLERLVEGLQDSVHRESERRGKLIAELQEQIQPGTMGAALAEDARSRGL